MIYFIGAGSGDPDLVTIKAQKIMQKANVVLYTGSLVPKEVLKWCMDEALIVNSQEMKYPEIFAFLEKYRDKIVARIHTGDPSIYSTTDSQVLLDWIYLETLFFFKSIFYKTLKH